MPFVTNTPATTRHNFLDSEVGLVTKTRQIPASMGVLDGTRKMVFAGTPFPSNDNQATGIIFDDVDVTSGDMPGSVMLAGRVLSDALELASNAKTALAKAGIIFVDAPAIERGWSVTYVKDDGEGVVPVDENSYFDGDTAKVSTVYPLTKAGNKQTGWATSSGGQAVADIKMTDDVTLYPVWTVNA